MLLPAPEKAEQGGGPLQHSPTPRGSPKSYAMYQEAVARKQADPTVRPRLRLMSIACRDDASRSRT